MLPQALVASAPSACDGHGLPIVAVSAPWLGAAHADPGGAHLRLLASALGAWLGRTDASPRNAPVEQAGAWAAATTVGAAAAARAAEAKDASPRATAAAATLGVFWDFAALLGPESDDARGGDSESDGRRGGASAWPLGRGGAWAWFAHAHTTVFLLPWPGETGGQRCAWCALEEEVAGYVTDPRRVLDLGQLCGPNAPIPPPASRAALVGACVRPSELLVAPTLPGAFEASLGPMAVEGRAGADATSERALVALQQRVALLHTLGAATQLSYAGRGWRPREAAALAELVRSVALRSLRWLCLGDNPLADEGVAHLARAFSTRGALPSLLDLSLFRVGVGDFGAVQLAEVIAGGALPALTMVDLGKNRRDRAEIAPSDCAVRDSRAQRAPRPLICAGLARRRRRACARHARRGIFRASSAMRISAA